MLRFKSLSLRNFLSYGNIPTVIQLDQPGTTLIVGEDLDNTERGTGANGVGKTVIVNALAYGMYDKPISNISKDNLVNNINKKNMEVAVEFETDGDTYLIRRVRKEKAGATGNYVQLFENGHDITPDSVGNTNRLIEKIIG
ncbi:MAG: AAA family ATPase, partial [Candidatus Heimdallarchaeota archaeon]|nr:AAA family ATPase [Candidatus Heimdallarchaeota archaeon]